MVEARQAAQGRVPATARSTSSRPPPSARWPSCWSTAERDVAVVTDDGSSHGRFLGLISTARLPPRAGTTWTTPSSRGCARPTHLVTAAADGLAVRGQHPDLGPPPRRAADRRRRRAARVDRAAPRLRAAQAVPQRVDRRREALPGRRRGQHPRLPRADPGPGRGRRRRALHRLLRRLLASGRPTPWRSSGRSYGDDVRIGAGNVVDGRAFRYLAEAGADFVKVGIGGGSICITRDQKGIGRGQASALIDVVAARDAYAEETGDYVPICCDGGLLNDYHMAVAFALGADFMMLGRYFARFDESPSPLRPGRRPVLQGVLGRGLAAGPQRGRATSQAASDELVFEEGVDGYVPYAGSLYDNGRRSPSPSSAPRMISCGATTLRSFHHEAVLDAGVAPELPAEQPRDRPPRDPPRLGRLTRRRRTHPRLRRDP